MKVVLAKSAGFCFGVQKAVDKVYEEIESNKTLYTYGPIIHNEEVVSDLASKGVAVIEECDLETVPKGTVIIRSHGVEKNVCDNIVAHGHACVDATCPFVKRIHNIVEEKSALGEQIVIVGNASHPEVQGIVGWSQTPVIVVETEEEATNFMPEIGKKLCIVAQTTFNYIKFHKIVEIFRKKGYNANIVNTICNATEERQTEARDIAKEADVMIVIGGRHSSNTRKLYEICAKECEQTYFIQTLADLELTLPTSVELVGITAGASTPNNIIEEVQNYVRINF